MLLGTLYTSEGPAHLKAGCMSITGIELKEGVHCWVLEGLKTGAHMCNQGQRALTAAHLFECLLAQLRSCQAVLRPVALSFQCSAVPLGCLQARPQTSRLLRNTPGGHVRCYMATTQLRRSGGTCRRQPHSSRFWCYTSVQTTPACIVLSTHVPRRSTKCNAHAS
jgi:hypothetical protein